MAKESSLITKKNKNLERCEARSSTSVALLQDKIWKPVFQGGDDSYFEVLYHFEIQSKQSIR